MGTVHFAAIDGDWGDDPDALAAALRADWQRMEVTPARLDGVAYELELDGLLGDLDANGRCISFKHGEDLVIRLAAWWRHRIPPDVRLAVFNDADVDPVYVEPAMTAAQLRDLIVAADRADPRPRTPGTG